MSNFDFCQLSDISKTKLKRRDPQSLLFSCLILVRIRIFLHCVLIFELTRLNLRGRPFNRLTYMIRWIINYAELNDAKRLDRYPATTIPCLNIMRKTLLVCYCYGYLNLYKIFNPKNHIFVQLMTKFSLGQKGLSHRILTQIWSTKCERNQLLNHGKKWIFYRLEFMMKGCEEVL